MPKLMLNDTAAQIQILSIGFNSYLISLMSLVDNGQGHPEPKVLKVSDFLWQLDDLRQEVDPQLEDTSSSGSSAHVVDGEDPACQNVNKHVVNMWLGFRQNVSIHTWLGFRQKCQPKTRRYCCIEMWWKNVVIPPKYSIKNKWVFVRRKVKAQDFGLFRSVKK